MLFGLGVRDLLLLVLGAAAIVGFGVMGLAGLGMAPGA